LAQLVFALGEHKIANYLKLQKMTLY